MSKTQNTTFETKMLRTIDAAALLTCAALSAGVFFAGLKPLLDTRAVMAQQRQQLAAQHEAASTSSALLLALRQQLSQTERAVQSDPLRLKPVDALNQRVAEITQLAQSGGLQIEKVRPSASVAGEHYQTVKIELAGAGSFQASSQFIHALHQNLPDIAVESLALEGRPVRPGQPAAPGFRLELCWYAAPPGG